MYDERARNSRRASDRRVGIDYSRATDECSINSSFNLALAVVFGAVYVSATVSWPPEIQKNADARLRRAREQLSII